MTGRRWVWVAMIAVSLAVPAFLLRAAPPGGGDDDTLPERLVTGLHGVFGNHHARAVHAKGVVVEGTFTPSAEARTLSTAALFAGPDSRVMVRFSDFTGLPDIADTDGNASPRGMAVKFIGADGAETDLVTHSVNGFPVATAAEFAVLLQAIAASGKDAPHPTPLERFFATHPAAVAFLTTPRPPPESYATLPYFGVNAFRFVGADHVEHLLRTRLVPVAGTHLLAPEQARASGPDYLAPEIGKRLASGPVRFTWMAQLAEPGDAAADPSTPWPETRRLVPLGTLTLTRLGADQAKLAHDLVFLPSRLPAGITAADPMIDIRTAAYSVSFVERQ